MSVHLQRKGFKNKNRIFLPTLTHTCIYKSSITSMQTLFKVIHSTINPEKKCFNAAFVGFTLKSLVQGAPELKPEDSYSRLNSADIHCVTLSNPLDFMNLRFSMCKVNI